MRTVQVLGIEAARSTIMKEIGDVLSNYGIAVDQRRGAIRASPHIHTSEGDIATLVAALRALR